MVRFMVYSFPITVKTNYHQFGVYSYSLTVLGVGNQNSISLGQNRGVSDAGLFPEALRENPFPCFRSF